jgi:hypothetical protein
MFVYYKGTTHCNVIYSFYLKEEALQNYKISFPFPIFATLSLLISNLKSVLFTIHSTELAC